MTVTLSSTARMDMCDALVDLIDGGDSAGKVQIYGGTRAAGPGTATAETKLAEFTLNDPAFGDTNSSGVATLDVDPELTATGLAAGTATWARFVDSDGTGVVDCKVSDTNGSGDLKLNTTTVSVGLSLSITSGTITMPAGTAD